MKTRDGRGLKYARVSWYGLVYSVHLHSNWAKYGTAAGQMGPGLRRRLCLFATQKAIIIMEVVIMAMVKTMKIVVGTAVIIYVLTG
jgi:hypothetical protein